MTFKVRALPIPSAGGVDVLVAASAPFFSFQLEADYPVQIGNIIAGERADIVADRKFFLFSPQTK